MAILDYYCENCKKNFEELVKSPDDSVLCPVCGKPARREWSGCVYSATGKPGKKCSGNCATCGGCK